MSKKQRLWIAAGILFCIPMLFYASGLIFMKIHALPLLEARPWSIVQYWQLYSKSPHRWLRVSLLLSSLIPWLAAAVLAYLGFKLRKQRALHGAARFATMREIDRAELFGNLPKDKNLLIRLIRRLRGERTFERTIILGKHNGQYITYGGYQFVLLAAPTRSGKGVGVVIPNCLNYSDSLVVLDIKLENFQKTAGFRHLHGQDIYLFCPYDENGITHRYNPLSYISEDPAFRIGDVDAIANALYTAKSPNEEFWCQQARDLFRGLCLFVLETPELPHTLGEILRQSSGKGKPLKDHVLGVVEERQKAGRPFTNACLDCLNRVLNSAEDTLSSVINTFTVPLKLFQNPFVDMATSGNDFDLRDVRKKRMSIYFGITPDHLADAGVLVSLFFDQLINLNSKQLPQDNKELKYQCLMIMDEFTAIGKVSMIAKSVSYQAGYNMRLLTIIQNKSQLEDVYGKAGAHTIVTNHGALIIYAPSPTPLEDAREYSEMLGYLTVKATSTSRGKNSSSESVSDQKRALLMPQEIRDIGEDKEIIVTNSCKPIFCQKIRYYLDPDFADRADKPTPPIPKHDVHKHLAMVDNRWREVRDEELENDSARVADNLKGSEQINAPDDELTPEAKMIWIEESATKCLTQIIHFNEMGASEEESASMETDIFGSPDDESSSPLEESSEGVPDDETQNNADEPSDTDETSTEEALKAFGIPSEESGKKADKPMFDLSSIYQKTTVTQSTDFLTLLSKGDETP